MRNAPLLLALAALLATPAAAQEGPVPSPEMPSRGGSVILKVVDYETARQELLAAAQRARAEVQDTRTEVNFQGKRQGWVRVRLAVDQLPGFLTSVRGIGKLYAENISAIDHLSEYEDLQRRVERLREHQRRLDALLRGSRRLRGSDILYIQERLYRAGLDEGSLLQRRAELERAARTSSVTVELFEPEPRRSLDVGNWYAGAALRARADLFRFLAKTTTAGAYVLFFAPFWVPALAVAVLLLRWLLRRGRAVLLRGRAAVATAWAFLAARWPVLRPAPPKPQASP
ncbi:MAG TPA: DUF4349 domain-containing protein [Armatimonadota bacterium]|nr:DUF4349 domain-containing protein [Armatimonadota bacterium]